jgi:hypothetical protein
VGLELIIQIIAGLIGGNAAGAGLKNLSLGTLGNSAAGAVGGGLGGLVLGLLGGDAGSATEAAAGAAANLDLTAIIQSVAGGGIGGAVLTAILGYVKKALAK